MKNLKFIPVLFVGLLLVPRQECAMELSNGIMAGILIGCCVPCGVCWVMTECKDSCCENLDYQIVPLNEEGGSELSNTQDITGAVGVDHRDQYVVPSVFFPVFFPDNCIGALAVEALPQSTQK